MNLDKKEIIRLLSDEENQNILFEQADKVRKQYVGDEVHLRGLIEFSNICRNNCLYCGIRSSNKDAQRYRMEPEEIIATAKQAANMGFKTVVMQSGEDMYYNIDRMCHIISEIKKFDVAITLSIGERSYEEYKAFREAGADRYLMRIETTDKDLYHKLDPNMSWQNRYDCLMMIKELGYELGSGIMVGLPNQSVESIAEDLLFLKDIQVDMSGIGPFIPHPQTPLSKEQGGSLNLALRTMAFMRLLLPDINIPATTAMETLHPQGRIMALQAGANVVMPNVNSGEYRKLYQLYPGKNNADVATVHAQSDIGQKISSIGRKIGQGYGGHKK
jgi:biotin synthase